ncbi:MAG TPA: flagellin FliC [Gammaproteobacteria bacterium]|nr:flagellin FliC [Gammaproteobacteria bacterium]|tara:strand:+ start:272 stop:1141 length:870 start_codon:yes stop_codon:yes gene_type:complete
MAVVNTNISASIAQAALARNERELTAAMEQLSTGKKINSAADNAAGLAITTRMTSQIRGLDQAIRNAHDAVSMVQTAEGALDEITTMLQRMRELAIQSGTGTTDAVDRTYLNQEYVALRAEIDRVADNTEWNGRVILNGNAGASAGGSLSAVTFQVGAGEAQTIAVNFGNFTNSDGSMSTLASTRLSAATIASAVSVASNAITSLDTAITAVSNQRASFGAVNNRLIHAVDNLTNISTNAAQTRSRIMDTDYAAATSELARTQIIQQAGTAMLAQANQLPGSVLQLLQS